MYIVCFPYYPLKIDISNNLSLFEQQLNKTIIYTSDTGASLLQAAHHLLIDTDPDVNILCKKNIHRAVNKTNFRLKLQSTWIQWYKKERANDDFVTADERQYKSNNSQQQRCTTTSRIYKE